MIRNLLAVAMTALLVCSVVMVPGCGGSSSSTVRTPASRVYLGTQAPGDVWNWTLTDTTFSATNTTSGATYTGTSSLLDSGFHKLVITTSSDSSVTAGAVFYAFEVPGVAMIARPAGHNTNPIVGAGISDCLANVTTFNWVTVPHVGWNPAQDNAYGVAIADTVGGTLTETDYLIDGTAGHSGSFSLTCSGGHYTASSSSVTAQLTPAGVFVVDGGAGMGGGVGVQAPASPIDLAALPNREYRGILFSQAHGGTQLIWARSDGSGGISSGGYTNVEATVAASGEDHTAAHDADVQFSAQPSPGLIQSTLTKSGVANPMVMMTNTIGGKQFIFGFANESGSADNFLLIEK